MPEDLYSNPPIDYELDPIWRCEDLDDLYFWLGFHWDNPSRCKAIRERIKELQTTEELPA
jgi:hypothetical protein